MLQIFIHLVKMFLSTKALFVLFSPAFLSGYYLATFGVLRQAPPALVLTRKHQKIGVLISAIQQGITLVQGQKGIFQWSLNICLHLPGNKVNCSILV